MVVYLTLFFSDYMPECECDIGGAYNNICNKTSGQCECKGNITQRQCDRFIVQAFLVNVIYLFITE